tara:strand:- start:1215 stop:2132 length:918 start_codon:yes stop_codon:yes gene_type:complete
MLESEVNEEIQQEVIEDGEIVEVETEELSDDAKAAIDDISVEEEQQVKKEDELEDYSKGVKKRIATLTKKMREQERAANSAYEYAQALQAENQNLKQSSTQLNKNYLSEAQNRLNSQRAQANAVLKNAYQDQDWDKVTKAQGILDKITVEESKLANSKPVVEQPTNYQTYQQPMRQQQQQMVQQQAEPDPDAEQWADKNEWFGQDETMTLTAFNIHRKLIEEEGFDTSDPAYYDEIDKRIRTEFPHKFSTGDEVKSNSKMQQNVAPAGRSDSSGRKRQVKLSASEVQMAKRLNVPLSEYAKYIKR